MLEYGQQNIHSLEETMLRIAICDDDFQELARISKLIERFRNDKEVALSFTVFSNTIDLLETMQKGCYDILLLDVLMPGLNGIQAAHEIRSFDSEIKIIFLTSSPEYAVESYSVDAYYYLMKPATPEKLFPILDRLFLDVKKLEEFLPIKSSFGIIRLPFCRLEYLEVISKKLFFHLTDGSVKEASGTLSEFEAELLFRGEFIKVHRSYIVNMGRIQEFGTKELITYSGKHIPISRLLYGQVRKAYMENLFAEKVQ